MLSKSLRKNRQNPFTRSRLISTTAPIPVEKSNLIRLLPKRNRFHLFSIIVSSNDQLIGSRKLYVSCKGSIEDCGLDLRRSAPSETAVGGDLPGRRNQTTGDTICEAVTFHLHRRCCCGEGHNQSQLLFPHYGLITLSASANVSTIEYIFVTPPTASFSVSP